MGEGRPNEIIYFYKKNMKLCVTHTINRNPSSLWTL